MNSFYVIIDASLLLTAISGIRLHFLLLPCHTIFDTLAH